MDLFKIKGGLGLKIDLGGPGTYLGSLSSGWELRPLFPCWSACQADYLTRQTNRAIRSACASFPDEQYVGCLEETCVGSINKYSGGRSCKLGSLSVQTAKRINAYLYAKCLCMF